jgi:hypothetical protein
VRAPGGLHLLFQFFLIIGLTPGADDNDRKLFIVIDAGYDVVGHQHVLVQQVADCQIFRVVVDRHGGDDFLAVEENRQRAFDGDGGVDTGPGLIDARNPLGQSWIERIGPDDVAVVTVGHEATIAEILARHENCPL